MSDSLDRTLGESLHVIQLQLLQRYGRNLIYPVNEPARDLCALTGRKTFLESDLVLLVRLGFVLEWIPQSIKLKEAP